MNLLIFTQSALTLIIRSSLLPPSIKVVFLSSPIREIDVFITLDKQVVVEGDEQEELILMDV